MADTISSIIQATELLKIYPTKYFVIVDASNGKNAKTNYEKKHLDGALFVDVNTQLANRKEDVSNGGRHPLPDIKQFSIMLTNLGISTKSHIVIYDDQNGSNAAARFWWMMKSVGHKKVQVLNGGLQQAERIGFPTNSKTEIPDPTKTYELETWKLPLADIFEVEKVSKDKNYVVIDVRSSERYNGEKETIDQVAGHIPGAINVPFTTNLDDNGLFLPPDELRIKYQKILNKARAENIIVHCGSGITACHTLLAIAYAGLEIPKLFVGSWSEWSRNNKTIETS